MHKVGKKWTNAASSVGTMPLVDLGKNLLEAARLGQIEAVQILLLNGALFTTDWLGNSALHFAALNGHTEMCEVLLRAGVSRDARTKVNRTPLHLAAQHGHLPIVVLLIDIGVDVHATDMIGMSALHWAVQKGHTDIVHLLMQRGANAALPNKFCKTPLDIAVDIGRRDLFELMQQLSSVISHELDDAATEEVESDLTLGDAAVTHDAVDNDMSALCVPDAVLSTVITDSDGDSEQCSHDHTPAEPSENTTVPVATVTIPNITTTIPQVTCHSVQSLHTAKETLLPSPSSSASSSSKTSTSAVHSRMTASDTLTWLKTHGTAVDNSSFVTSMLTSGQKVVLTEAGKLLMNAVKPLPDVTCRQLSHSHDGNKNKKSSDEEHTDAPQDKVKEPLLKKLKCAEDEITGQQQFCIADSEIILTDNTSSLKQQPRTGSGAVMHRDSCVDFGAI